MTVRSLTTRERHQAEVSEGLLVERATGAAAGAGVQPGDLILKAGTENLHSADDLRQAADKAKGDIALLIQREDARIYVPVPLH